MFRMRIITKKNLLRITLILDSKLSDKCINFMMMCMVYDNDVIIFTFFYFQNIVTLFEMFIDNVFVWSKILRM